MSLYISQSDIERLRECARRAHPQECCGLLIGERRGGNGHVEAIIPAENIAEGDRTKNYQIDWKTLFETVRRTRHETKDIIGFYHSHPDGSVEPSRKDTESAWVRHSYVLIPTGTVDGNGPTSWSIPDDGGKFCREEIIAV